MIASARLALPLDEWPAPAPPAPARGALILVSKIRGCIATVRHSATSYAEAHPSFPGGWRVSGFPEEVLVARIVVVVALALVLAASACRPPRPAQTAAPIARGGPTVNHPPDARPTLVEAAACHLAAGAPADRPLVLFVPVGAGETASALAAQLRAALSSRTRVVYASVAVTPGGPLPTPPPGSHVHSVERAVTPWPDRVVRFTATDAGSSIAVRLTGSDPSGPAEHGWEWFETRGTTELPDDNASPSRARSTVFEGDGATYFELIRSAEGNPRDGYGYAITQLLVVQPSASLETPVEISSESSEWNPG